MGQTGRVSRESARWYDAFYRDEDYAWEAGELTRIIRDRHPDAATLLDIGCGSGRHLVHLSDAFACTGVDVDGHALALAGRRVPRGVRLRRGDMRTLDLGRRYDVVTSLFSAIGFMRTRTDLRRAIRVMARHLAPGGVLVVEPWFLADTWGSGPEPTVEEVRIDGGTLVRVITITRRGSSTSRLHIHHVLAGQRGIRSTDETHTLGLFTVADHVEAFARAGLAVDFDPVGLTHRGLFVATTAS